MDKIDFWKKASSKVADIVEFVDKSSDATFLFMVNIKENVTWCSDKTKEFFGLSSQIFSDFEPILQEFVHPFDREEYAEEITKRMNGLSINKEL